MTDATTDAVSGDRQARAIRRLLRSFYSTDSYGLVLLMIVVTYVLAVSLSQQWGASLLLAAQIGTVWLVLHTSRAKRRLRVVAKVLLLLAGFTAVANLFAGEAEALVVFTFMAASILYFVAPFAIVRHIGYRRDVDQETMLGALSAYIIIGMAFAFCYRFLGAVQSEPFFGASGDGRVSEDLFFSFVTLTTTGYGNLVPADNPGQSLAVLEALIGQLFLVTALAKVVNAWRPRVWRQSDAGGVPTTSPPVG
jgi:Ion channel